MWDGNLHHISAQPGYETSSPEELRWHRTQGQPAAPAPATAAPAPACGTPAGASAPTTLAFNLKPGFGNLKIFRMEAGATVSLQVTAPAGQPLSVSISALPAPPAPGLRIPSAAPAPAAAAAPPEPAGDDEECEWIAKDDDGAPPKPAGSLGFTFVDAHWQCSGTPPDWHLTVLRDGRRLHSIRLDEAAGAALRLCEADRSVLLRGPAADAVAAVGGPVLRLSRPQWLRLQRLLSRAVTENVCGQRLWSQEGRRLLRRRVLPSAAAAAAAAAAASFAAARAHPPAPTQPPAASPEAEAQSPLGGAPDGTAASRGSPPAPASPSELLHQLRAAAPAECLTAQPPAARPAAPGSPKQRGAGDCEASLERLRQLQAAAAAAVPAGKTDAP